MTTFDNVISGSDFSNSLMQSLRDIDSVLYDHSGPFACNAILGSKWRQHNDIDEFTKDGIKILRYLIVSEDPVTRFAARLCRNIGISVDHRCHDGTTTSMNLFCQLAMVIAQLNPYFGNYKRNRFVLSSLVKEVLEDILKNITNFKITDQDIFEKTKEEGIETTLEDIRAAIAYRMSMVASKGDKALSKKISILIKNTPPHVYGVFQNIQMVRETEEKYILEKQDWDISQNASIGHNREFNHMNGTQYLSNDAVLFVTANDLVAESYESGFLTSLISRNPRYRADLYPEFGMSQGWEELCEGKRNLVIISPSLTDSGLIEAILKFNTENPTAKIIWFNVNVKGRMSQTFTKTINYISGTKLFMDTYKDASKSLIGLNRSGVTVKFIGSNLTLSNLYDKDGSVYHPYYNDETAFPDYTFYKKELEELLDFVKTNTSNPALDQDEFNYVCGMYRTLTTQNIYNIKVAGRAHDQRSNVTVYEDAIGASMSALEEGIVLSGYYHICNFLKNKYDIFAEHDLSIFTKDMVARCIYIAITNVLDYSMCLEDDSSYDFIKSESADNKWNYIFTPTIKFDISNFIHEKSEKGICLKSSLEGRILEDFIKADDSDVILTQSYAGYDEQFKRFVDIIPRLALSESLIDMRTKDADSVS